jgi:hypothetical protein
MFSVLSLFTACLVSCDKFILLYDFKIFYLQVFFVSVLLNRFFPFFWGWFGWVFFVFMQCDFFFLNSFWLIVFGFLNSSWFTVF